MLPIVACAASHILVRHNLKDAKSFGLPCYIYHSRPLIEHRLLKATTIFVEKVSKNICRNRHYKTIVL
ncbi:hypothetical protein Mp_1g04420 [Marchantia polymorpha subsp. ruderalis]|uniref:Uncharacterized protein n=2 Tax=Marchantia polymorpha TaxID=3197 RepID=A0AAF6ALG1_MARPO|nr:hypothetical protein MARPO_0005s0165 [Marchantia polymorpha]BBM97281.1 hypothetical protein Mp_1g04420 [Marchantia polymorpha subsp. ruderalis]|eukprot:PTQ48526.1 hypothetical protein MARPO_0005s0165 [Marchantia polymorpha]